MTATIRVRKKKPPVSIRARVKIFRSVLDWFNTQMIDAESAIDCGCMAIGFKEDWNLKAKLRSTYKSEEYIEKNPDASWDNAPPEKITKWLNQEMRKRE